MTGAAPAPDVPLAAFVDGLLDGRVADAAALRDAVHALGSTGAGVFRCELQGGRFSMLPNETRIAGPFDDRAQTRFLTALQELVRTAAPGSVETNLRCRLVYADEVAETLFVVRGDRVEPLTRRRPRTPADLVDATPAAAAALPFGLRRREVLWLAPLLAVLALVLAWRGGYVDRVFAARAESLRIDTGAFAAMLTATVERSWGEYHVKLRRGAEYPATPAAVAERLAKLTDTAQHTACAIVGDGRDLFVQLLDDADHVLAEASVDVRALLVDSQGEALVRLPGQIGAATLRLAIARAPRPQ